MYVYGVHLGPHHLGLVDMLDPKNVPLPGCVTMPYFITIAQTVYG